MFDYVIVGAGSAGCVLAARLAEDPDVRVAVVEAGPPDSEPMIERSRCRWRFGSCGRAGSIGGCGASASRGSANGATCCRRGRVLGGSSSLNVMIYMRGNRLDYDGWAAMGLSGWGYDDVLPYFRRSEDNERGESYYHGVGGPLTVSDCRSMHPLVGACIEAAVDAAIAPTDDHNRPTQEGTGWFQFTQRNGRRCSTAVAYLRPAVDQGNVEVLTDALATRIVFERGRAVGVEILRNNNVETLRGRLPLATPTVALRPRARR